MGSSASVAVLARIGHRHDLVGIVIEAGPKARVRGICVSW